MMKNTILKDAKDESCGEYSHISIRETIFDTVEICTENFEVYCEKILKVWLNLDVAKPKLFIWEGGQTFCISVSGLSYDICVAVTQAKTDLIEVSNTSIHTETSPPEPVWIELG